MKLARPAVERIQVRLTAAGAWTLGAVLLVLLAAINYGSNLLHAMAFLLLAVWLLSAFTARRQLDALRLRAPAPQLAACGETLPLEVAVETTDARLRHALALSFAGRDGVPLDVPGAGAVRPRLELLATQRGVHQLDALELTSRWPFGWWRAARRVQAAPCTVHPAPRGAAALPDSSPLPAQRAEGAESFAQLRDYQPGDALARIDWRGFARHGELTVRHFDGERGAASRRLRWDDASGDAETRLAQLARWVFQADACGGDYALELPDAVVPPGQGSAHRDACLIALAKTVPSP